ncbi:MAG: hypothetical protein E5X58_34265 [Mesorhizobium sp.]|nr:MAG: hypothetical protein E5X58_34265 [Mesorhizobium sp.]
MGSEFLDPATEHADNLVGNRKDVILVEDRPDRRAISLDSHLFLVACGGSLSIMMAGKYFIDRYSSGYREPARQ